MTKLYAQPYDISAVGFYFDSEAEYNGRAAKARNSYGGPVEEFELEFIDGEALDAQLFEALQINQCNFARFFDAVEVWSDDDKIKVIIAVGEVGYSFDLESDAPDKFEVDLYTCDTLTDLAMQFVEDGLFGEIPKAIENYLDYDAIGRDLGVDYTQTTINGTRYIYRCD